MTSETEPTEGERELLAAAHESARKAYAPISGFMVGAALRGRSGQIYTGCNVENASVGLSVCAERVAVFKAVSAGERQFVHMAVVSAHGQDAPPCGACRQVLAEFAPGLPLIFWQEGRIVRVNLSELMPYPFTQSDSGPGELS